jgi:hypothetical protein
VTVVYIKLKVCRCTENRYRIEIIEAQASSRKATGMHRF